MTENPQAQPAIDIIGMTCHFPGAATPSEFWQNLVAGKGRLTRIPALGMVESDPFDASFPGIGPDEAELMEPQRRAFLECAREALEDAGYDPEN